MKLDQDDRDLAQLLIGGAIWIAIGLVIVILTGIAMGLAARGFQIAAG